MRKLERKVSRNTRFYGLVVVLVLVVLALLFMQNMGQPPITAPPNPLDNVPELGKVPTQEQIENRPPARK